ncbi:hypothetical protein LTSEGIV_5320 [Salmonella enterica subsp. enterica serovar Give str. S5-487]|nr:hypothetical protein LTSEGIV_5320 [Salmonella enterica subsp. enterica serovar Give str. S5-487]
MPFLASLLGAALDFRQIAFPAPEKALIAFPAPEKVEGAGVAG